MPNRFEAELRHLINRHSMEQYSGTPDFILAKYLNRCLNAFTDAVQERTQWYNRRTVPNLEQADSGCRTCVENGVCNWIVDECTAPDYKRYVRKHLLFNCPPLCDKCGRIHKIGDFCQIIG